MKKTILLFAVLITGLYGCGSPEGSLSTSTVTASVDTLVMDSDVVAWVDATGAKATACGATSFPSIPVADSVNVAIKSTAYANTGSMGLGVRVESATISYTPANSATPAMAPEYQTVGLTIANGATTTVPVRVATQEQKLRLQTALACNNTIYNYYTKISMDVTEIGTNKKSTVETAMQLRFADFIDK